MCDICGRSICASGCPNNTDDAGAVYICALCGTKIYEGDTAYRIREDVLCEDCVLDAAIVV